MASYFYLFNYKQFKTQLESQWKIKSQSVLSFCGKKAHAIIIF